MAPKYHPSAQSTLRIAVLFEANQLSDIMGIDIIGNCSAEYMTLASAEFPLFGALLPHCPNIEYLYVSSTLEPAFTTPSVRIVPTHTYESCPRDVDIMVVGGPALSHRPDGSLRLMRDIAELGKATIMTVCVGSIWVADSGIFADRKVTTNRGFLAGARERNKDLNWIDQRWVVDKTPGKCELWTAGGAGCGIDMFATFVLEHFHPLVAQAAVNALDFDPSVKDQGREYSKPLKNFAES